jgi:hypothetical protein
MIERVPLHVFDKAAGDGDETTSRTPEEQADDALLPPAWNVVSRRADIGENSDPLQCRRCRAQLIPGLGSCPACGAFNAQSAEIIPERPAEPEPPPQEPFSVKRFAGGVTIGLGMMLWDMVVAAVRYALQMVAASLRYFLRF